MAQTDADKLFTPFVPPKTMPFFYDAVSFMWAYFKVPAGRVEPYLEGTGLTVARFSDLGDDVVVSLNFQNYLSNLGLVLTTVLEVEFNIHCYPTGKAAETPLMPLREYLQGQEQTKWIGGFRLHVPADDPIAVQAGTQMFGERKFLTQFAFSVPVANHPVAPGTDWAWEYWCFDEKYNLKNDPRFENYDPNKPQGGWNPFSDPVPEDANYIYRLRAHLDHLGPPVFTNPSPLTLYSLLPGGAGEPPDNGRLNASRWNILGLDQTWFDIDQPGRREWGNGNPVVKIDYGPSDHEMRKDMEHIIGDTPACAIRYFQSPPAAIENRAFWIDEQ
jgi:hypothetical protein